MQRKMESLTYIVESHLVVIVKEASLSETELVLPVCLFFAIGFLLLSAISHVN